MIRGVKVMDLEEHTDNRGILKKILKQSQMLDGSKSFGEIYVVTIKPGLIRANHYHESTTEFFCSLKGKGKLTLEDNKTKEKEEYTLDGSKIIKVPPFVAHAIYNYGKEDMVVLAYADKEYNREKPDSVGSIVL